MRVAALDTINHATPILRDWLIGFQDLGHETEYFPTEWNTISSCRVKDYDLILTVGAANPSEFEKVKKENSGIKIVHAVDSFRPDLLELKGVIDFLITTQVECPPLVAAYAEHGISLYNVPLAGNDRLFYPLKEKKVYDFSFIGGLSHGGRGLETRFYPYLDRGFLAGHTYQGYGVPFLPHEECNLIRARTKININAHVGYQMQPGIRQDFNQSLINIALSGGFQIVDFPLALEMFSGNVPVTTEENHHETCMYFLEHKEERGEMARKSCEIAQGMTWKYRMKEFLEILENHECINNQS